MRKARRDHSLNWVLLSQLVPQISVADPDGGPGAGGHGMQRIQLSFFIKGHNLSIDLLHLKHRPMLRRRIALLFNLNLNPFCSVKVNLLDFNDAND